jgi:hypothetical protein
MTYVSVSDCRPSYLSVTNCRAVLETVNYMKFSQLLVAVTNAYCHFKPCGKSCHIMDHIFQSLVEATEWTTSVTPVRFIKIVLVLSTARKVLESIPYPTGMGLFYDVLPVSQRRGRRMFVILNGIRYVAWEVAWWALQRERSISCSVTMTL